MVKAVVNRLLLSRRLFYLTTERDDLYQIGWMALNNCIDKFDESRGVKFDTYATKAIRNAVNNELFRLSKHMMSSLSNESGIVDSNKVFPRDFNAVAHTIENSGQFSIKERNVFWLRFNDEQHFEDIGKQVGASRETVRRMYYKTLEKLKELVADE